jgi:hypothetical protein
MGAVKGKNMQALLLRAPVGDAPLTRQSSTASGKPARLGGTAIGARARRHFRVLLKNSIVRLQANSAAALS